LAADQRRLTPIRKLALLIPSARALDPIGEHRDDAAQLLHGESHLLAPNLRLSVFIGGHFSWPRINAD
jgi:hypothetical protein